MREPKERRTNRPWKCLLWTWLLPIWWISYRKSSSRGEPWGLEEPWCSPSSKVDLLKRNAFSHSSQKSLDRYQSDWKSNGTESGIVKSMLSEAALAVRPQSVQWQSLNFNENLTELRQQRLVQAASWSNGLAQKLLRTSKATLALGLGSVRRPQVQLHFQHFACRRIRSYSLQMMTF